ncbi:MAG: toxin [Alphaproteobacteria bacterium]|nr:toxin [Alphaproteobacteria bacterium]
MDKVIEWSEEKSEWLRNKYGRMGVGFETCETLIKAGQILDIIENVSSHYPKQKMFVLEIKNYIYLVPFVETDKEIFLKTLYPSRKYTAIYLEKGK